MDELNTLLAQMDAQSAPSQPQQPPAQGEPPPTEEPAPAQTTPQPDGKPPSEPAPKPGQSPSAQTPQQVFEGDKSSKAFAEMRIKNAALEKIVGQLAGLMGVQRSEDVVPTLQQKIMEFQSRTQNIPPEVLERLQKAEEFMSVYQADQLATQATLGFQKVKETFKLNDDDLTAFAQELYKQGKNPYISPVNLIQEYKLINFDKLLAQAAAAASEQALELKKKGETQGSQPTSIKSPPSAGGAASGMSLAQVLAQMDGK